MRPFQAVFLAVCLFFGSVSTAFAADQKISLFLKRYDRADGMFTSTTPDGGFLVLANVRDEEPTKDPILLIKFSSDGQREWETTISDIVPSVGGALIVSGSGARYDIYVSGTSVTREPGYSKIVRLDSNGEIEWQKILRLADNYAVDVNAISLLPNGQILAVGHWSERTSYYSIYYYRKCRGFHLVMDANGTLATEFIGFGEESVQSTLRSVAVMKDGSFVAVGARFQGISTHYTNNGAPQSPRPLVASFTASRELANQRLSSEDADGFLNRIVGKEDGTRWLAVGTLGGRPYLELVASNGAAKRPITSVEKDYLIRGATVLPNGNFLLAGARSSATYRPAALELSATGMVLWERTYKSDSESGVDGGFLSAVVPLSADRFIFAGQSHGKRLWVFETNEQGLQPQP